MLDALRSDHRAITEELADPASALHSHPALIAREQLVMRLVSHFVAEEQYLYPTVRAHLDSGAARADAGFTADRHIEEQLKALEDPELTEDRLAAIWAPLQAEFAAHVAAQETLFSELAAVCTPEQLDALGDGVIGAEQLAPTRPRLVAVESSGANKLISLVEGYIDQVRDYYSKRGVD
jgi:hypothetical protein